MKESDDFGLESLLAQEQQRAVLAQQLARYMTELKTIRDGYYPELRLIEDGKYEELAAHIKAALDEYLEENDTTLSDEEYNYVILAILDDKFDIRNEFIYFSHKLALNMILLDQKSNNPDFNTNEYKKLRVMEIVQQLKSGQLSDSLPFAEIANAMMPGEPLSLDENSAEYKKYQQLWETQQIENIDGDLAVIVLMDKAIDFRTWLANLLVIDADHNWAIDVYELMLPALWVQKNIAGGEIPPDITGSTIELLRSTLEKQGYDTRLAEAIYAKMTEIV